MSTEKNDKKLHAVFLGENGFPYGMAAIQTVIMISKSLISVGAQMTVVNRKGRYNPDKPREMDVNGNFEGIDYVYTSGSYYRPHSFVTRTRLKIKGLIGEYRFLRQLKKKNELDVAIISCHEFPIVFLYRLYSWMMGFPIVLIYVEWQSKMSHRTGLKNKINDYLFDNWLISKFDAAFPISQVLQKNYIKIAPNKPYFKIPVLCEFELFNKPKNPEAEKFFLYCGAIGYREVIDFILDAYDLLPMDSEHKLYLVLGDTTEQNRKEFRAEIKKKYKRYENVVILHHLPYSELVQNYIDATALLIPMRPTLQDAARFPHKIGEYVASKNPMVTSNFGEVKHYFTDGHNALIADDYDVEQYAEKMKFVIDNPEESIQIGINGYQVGQDHFNNLKYGPDLIEFLQKLAGKPIDSKANGKEIAYNNTTN